MHGSRSAFTDELRYAGEDIHQQNPGEAVIRLVTGGEAALSRRTLSGMRIALGSDDSAHLVGEIARHLEKLGHTVTTFGAAAGVTEPWGRTAVALAEAVASGQHERGVVCCWTGTGVSIAANKVHGVRAALCGDAETARGARKWNDANVLALSLRATSPEIAREILSAFLDEPYGGTEGESLSAIHEHER